jgi:hypothetical protein
MTMEVSPEVLRILHAPSQRFFKTSDNSLSQYAIILCGELKDKAEAADTLDEGLWNADAACLVLELLIRLQTAQNELRMKEIRNNPVKWDER